MKYVVISLTLATAALAQSPFERELGKLGEQRERDLNAATDPINRRYKESLDALLRRATQAGECGGFGQRRSNWAACYCPEPAAS